jgi:AraC-like DNA-binding protein
MLCLNPIKFPVHIPRQGTIESNGLDPARPVFELVYGSEHIEKDMQLSQENTGPFLGVYFNLGDEFGFTIPTLDDKVVRFYKNHFAIAYLPQQSATFHLKKGAYASLTFNVIPRLPRLWIHQFAFLDQLIESMDEQVPFYMSNKPFFATDDMLRKIQTLLCDRHHGYRRDTHFYFTSIDIFIACLEHVALCRKNCITRPASLYNNDKILEHTLKYIKDRLRDTLTLNLIAYEVGMEPKTLTRLFKRVYNKTVMQVVFDKRMEEGTRLLQVTKMTIEQVARVVGYRYHTHFTNAYKRKYKRFPSEVRRTELAV